MKTINNNSSGVRQPNQLWRAALAGLALAASVNASQAQVVLSVSSFSGSLPAGMSFQNWNGSDAGASLFTYNGTEGNPAGSLQLTCDFGPPSTDGGVFIIPAASDNIQSGYTAIEYDVKVDPSSPLDSAGNACDLKVGIWDNSYNTLNTDLNIAPVSTNGGWQHVVVPFSSIHAPGVGPTIQAVLIQEYDANYTSAATNLIYIDNIKFTGPAQTYPNYVAFTFNDPSYLGGISGTTNSPWYGGENDVEWSALDSSNNASSGSAHVTGTISAPDNNDIMSWPFQTNTPMNYWNAGETNIIDGTHYQSVEFDVMWDTNSTMSLSNFNAAGDVSGFPIAIMEGQDDGGANNLIEAMGSAGPTIPDAATNGWVHLTASINRSTPGLQDVTGLGFKKYDGNAADAGLTYGYYVDNVVFDGAPILPASPQMSVSLPVKGLNIINNSGSPYDREGIATYNYNFSFVDQPNPVTYAMNIAFFPSTNYPSYEDRIYLVPNSAATEAEPDYAEANLMMIDINRNGAGLAEAILRAKTNSPNENGDLYDGGNVANPTFTAATSTILGNWTFTFTQNTNILVKAPDGSSTNLAFPLGLAPSDVSSIFGSSMVVYFGGYNNGAGASGRRTVLASVGITNGATSLLADNFLTDTQIDDVSLGGSTWVLASDTTGANDPSTAIFLLSPTTKLYVDWTAPAAGFNLETNGNLSNSAEWSTNTGLTPETLGNLIQVTLDKTNLPASGNVFFRVKYP